MRNLKRTVGVALVLSMMTSMTAQADTSAALQQLLALTSNTASQDVSLTDIKVADCTELSVYANKTKREMDSLKAQITALAQRDLKAQSQLSAEKEALEDEVKRKQAELAVQEAAKQDALAAAAKAVTTTNSGSSGTNLLGSLVSAVASTTPAGGLLGALASGLTSGLSQQAPANAGLSAAEAEAAVAQAKRLAEQKALELKEAQDAAKGLGKKFAPKLDESEIQNLTAKYTKLQNDSDTIRIYQSSRNCTAR